MSKIKIVWSSGWSEQIKERKGKYFYVVYAKSGSGVDAVENFYNIQHVTDEVEKFGKDKISQMTLEDRNKLLSLGPVDKKIIGTLIEEDRIDEIIEQFA